MFLNDAMCMRVNMHTRTQMLTQHPFVSLYYIYFSCGEDTLWLFVTTRPTKTLADPR